MYDVYSGSLDSLCVHAHDFKNLIYVHVDGFLR
jgi:hypothetical protein